MLLLWGLKKLDPEECGSDHQGPPQTAGIRVHASHDLSEALSPSACRQGKRLTMGWWKGPLSHHLFSQPMLLSDTNAAVTPSHPHTHTFPCSHPEGCFSSWGCFYCERTGKTSDSKHVLAVAKHCSSCKNRIMRLKRIKSPRIICMLQCGRFQPAHFLCSDYIWKIK